MAAVVIVTEATLLYAISSWSICANCYLGILSKRLYLNACAAIDVNEMNHPIRDPSMTTFWVCRMSAINATSNFLFTLVCVCMCVCQKKEKMS